MWPQGATILVPFLLPRLAWQPQSIQGLRKRSGMLPQSSQHNARPTPKDLSLSLSLCFSPSLLLSCLSRLLTLSISQALRSLAEAVHWANDDIDSGKHVLELPAPHINTAKPKHKFLQVKEGFSGPPCTHLFPPRPPASPRLIKPQLSSVDLDLWFFRASLGCFYFRGLCRQICMHSVCIPTCTTRIT